MRLLLDTHVIVWASGQPDRLTRRVAGALTDSRNELWMSAISSWEVALLAERGRLALQPDAAAWLASAVAGLGLREAPLTSAIALESRQIRMPTEDPADRFIAATARAYDCTLVTADAALRRLPGVRVVFFRPVTLRHRRTGLTSGKAEQFRIRRKPPRSPPEVG